MNRALSLLGCICLLICSEAVAQRQASKGRLEFRAARTTPAVGYPVAKSLHGTSFYLSDTALLSDDDFESAKTDTSASNGVVLDVRLEPRAAARLQEFSQHHVGEYLAILFNGTLLGTPPRIMDPLSQPAIILTGLPLADAQRLAAAVAARKHSGP